MNLTATTFGIDVRLQWSAVAGAVKFRVKRGKTKIALVKRALWYFDTAPVSGALYEVAAMTKTGLILERATAAVGGVVVDPPPPPPPPPPVPVPSTDFPGVYRDIVGGNGGRRIEVRNLAELRAACALTERRHIVGIGQWWASLAGQNLAPAGNVTIDFDGASIVLYDGGLFPREGSQFIFRSVVVRAGDRFGNPDDLDATTLNGTLSNVAYVNCEFAWAPDVVMVFRPIGGGVNRVYVYRTVIAEGLFHSWHSQSTGPKGHGLGVNVVAGEGGAPVRDVLFHESLVMQSQGRQPRIIGAERVEWINPGFYNYHEGPSGNPRSMHIVGGLWKHGPAPAAAGLTGTGKLLFRFQGNPENPVPYPGGLWISDPRTEGFVAQAPGTNEARLMASGPLFPQSVTACPSAETESLLVGAGPVNKDATSQKFINDFRNGTGRFASGRQASVNGNGTYPPTPVGG